MKTYNIYVKGIKFGELEAENPKAAIKEAEEYRIKKEDILITEKIKDNELIKEL